MRVSNPNALGQTLGDALFVPTLRDMFLRSVNNARQAGARLQLQLHFDNPELLGLPWEWLMLPSTSASQLGLRSDTTLVRINHLHSPQEPPAPLRLNGPLRILAIASETEELQLDTLRRELKEAIRNQQIELRTIHRATPLSITRALAEFSPHVLHCAARITFGKDGIPLLQLERSISIIDLTNNCSEAPELRVVMLTGAQGDARAISAIMPSIATMLVQSDLPAVISLGAQMPANATALCAAVCYEQLAKAAPIDLAVTAGRAALAKQHVDRNWGFVQLQLLPGAEHIFQRSNRRTQQISRSNIRTQQISRSNSLLKRPQPRAHYGQYQFTKIPSFLVAMLAIMAIVALFTMLGYSPNQPTFGVLIASSTPIATLQQPPSIAPTPIPPPQSYATYIIGPDDTLEAIATQMGSTPTAIADLNRLGFTKALHAGRVLMVPQYQPSGNGAGGQLVERGNPNRPTIALTFDIEIDGDSVRSILLSLKERNLKGTFFVTGLWVEAYPDLAREIVQQGHEIANHSYTHPYFTQIGPEGATNELEKTEALIQATTGFSARPYFRFPYGASNRSVLDLVAQHGYIAYHWTADDASIPAWLERTTQTPSAANGSILLMHGRASTAEALPEWLDRIIELGLHPTTLGETLR